MARTESSEITTSRNTSRPFFHARSSKSLRHCMAEQLNFVNAKMEHFVQERPSKALGPVPQAIAWSDGFKSHELSVPAVDGTLYGKMGKALWKSAPALTTLKRASKSLPQLPPL